jgi:hypothetical protein
MKRNKHQPGIMVNRQFESYNDWQAALWNAFDDFYHADVGGYAMMRMPTPGKSLEPTHSYNLDFHDWKLRVQERWRVESGRDSQTRGAEEADFPENLWYYLYERFLDATNRYYTPRHKPTTTSHTPVINTSSDPGLQSLNTNRDF